jgi:heme exporter protein D
MLVSSTCSISAGQLYGGFTVATTASVGGYVVTVTTDKGEQLSAPFSVTGTTTTTPSSGFATPSCIIATATFGSEAAPAVQFLRNFRDGLVVHTSAGSAFMTVFNAWYYSFSPQVAGFIAAHDPLRAPMRVILYPLLGILGLSAFTYSVFSGAPEFAIVMAGLLASSLIGLVYLTFPALAGMRALLKRRAVARARIAKISIASLAMSLLLLTAGEVAGSFVLLAIGSSAVVLTCIIAVPVNAALAIVRKNPR